MSSEDERKASTTLKITDKDNEFGDRLIASMAEALEHARGEANNVRETQIKDDG